MRTLALIVFTVVFVSNSAIAVPFSFDASTCSISSESTVALAIGEEKLESRIRTKLVMVGEPTPIPQLQLTFLTHEPAQASFEWSSIIHSKKEVKLFRSEIFDRVIQRQGKPFAMNRISAAGERATFASTIDTMEALQDMMALFLSQNEFVVHALTDEGDDWAGTVSLTMSDASFRQMAAKCYAQFSSKYLTATGERIKLEATSDSNSLGALPYYWSEGYGLTAYTELQSLIPIELKDSFIFSETDSDEARQTKLTDWLAALTRKQNTLAELQTTNDDPAFIAVNTELAENYSILDSTYSRFVVLTGDAATSDGLIQQKMKEQETLQVALADVESKIRKSQNILEPLVTHESETSAALSPFMEYLNNVDKMTAAHNARITEIAALRTHLEQLLSRHQDAAAVSLQTPPADGPWSIEVIEKQDKEAASRLLKAQTLAALQNEVKIIVGDLDLLLEKSTIQQVASMTYLQAVAEQRSLKAELTKEETWLYQSRQVPKFTVAARQFFDALNATVESELASQLADAQAATPEAVRDYKWEFEFHSNVYNRHEAEFVNIADIMKRQGSLISAILCHPNVLKDEKNRTQPCLTVDDILDEKIVDNFLSTLPPKEVDELLGTVPRPWNQEQSKTQLLFAKYESEIANPTARLQELVDSWGAIRQIIWRWVTLQKKAKAFDPCTDRDDAAATLFSASTYSLEFYNKVIQCERDDVQVHRDRKQQLLQAMAGRQSAIQQAEAAFETANQDYELASQSFINGAVAQLREIPILTEQTDIFTKCLLPLESTEECVDAVDQVSSGALARKAQNEYVDLVQALVNHIYGRMTALGQENATVVSEVHRLENERADYVSTNNVTPLLEKRDALKAQIAASQSELLVLTTTLDQKRTVLADSQAEEKALKGEAQALVTELTVTKDKIKAALPTLMPFCARILPYSRRLQMIDVELYEQLGKAPPAQPKKYSSCQVPNLENYVPAPTALELSSASMR